MADPDFTPGGDVLVELMGRLGAEIGVYIAEQEPDAVDLPQVTRDPGPRALDSIP
jgi:hypothetical protein